MIKPNIKGCIARAIEALESCDSYDENDYSIRQFHDEKLVKQALADLKAFEEALPDDLAENIADYDSHFPTKEYGYPAAIGAAKLTAEAVKND